MELRLFLSRRMTTFILLVRWIELMLTEKWVFWFLPISLRLAPIWQQGWPGQLLALMVSPRSPTTLEGSEGCLLSTWEGLLGRVLGGWVWLTSCPWSKCCDQAWVMCPSCSPSGVGRWDRPYQKPYGLGSQEGSFPQRKLKYSFQQKGKCRSAGQKQQMPTTIISLLMLAFT